ncbi:MAG: M23 family metallopeptidase [Pseudonocardia sp.]|nr:M23 family metallopeptidase [Pseudonocardia sp.]OJY54441.1 MAG: hypothetical protein BGP03_22930 [Pseudonocardia sp. 73-21]
MATGAVATGAAVLVAPVVGSLDAVTSLESTSALMATISPVAQRGVLERHPPGAADADVPSVGGAEAHDVVDASNLVKAVEVGEELARRAAAVRAAAADGAPDVAVGRQGTFVRPAAGVLTSMAGARWGTTHYGLDIANAVGTPIFAVTDGVVVESGPASGFGLWVRVRHPGGWTSVYGHIDRSLVREGQRVRAGEWIALMGNRGRSTGPHLHVEIWDADDARVDPRSWLAARGIWIT